MGAVAVCEHRDFGGVEIDPGEVLVIRILTGVNAARHEPSLAFVLVHTKYFADDPVSRRELAFHRAGFRVIQIQVVPPVAFGSPDQFVAAVEPVQLGLLGVVDEGGTALVHHRADLSRHRVDAEHLKALMAALVVEHEAFPAVA